MNVLDLADGGTHIGRGREHAFDEASLILGREQAGGVDDSELK
ncbi:MAG: hypothetical protein AAF235_04945 [Planctomycetota bacterium]